MEAQSPGNGTHVLRQINRTAVLRAVRASAEPPRVTELTKVTGLSRPAVTRGVTDLVDVGLVEWVGAGEAGNSIGRPAQRVRFRAEAGFVAGLDVRPRRVHVVLVDLAGEQIAARDVSAAPAGRRIVKAAADGIAAGASAAGLSTEDLWAITVGTPGIVDPNTGTVEAAPSIPGWAGLPVAASLSRRYSCPVQVENDTNLAALAEQASGAAAGCANFVYVHWDERVGTGLVIADRLYRGASSSAGELGFLDLIGDLDRPPDGPRTAAFDGAGTFERLVGTAAIRELALSHSAEVEAEQLHRLLLDTDADHVFPTLFERAADGDDTAAAICERVTSRFAAGLAALLLLIDPEVVVVGGSVAAAGQPLLDALHRQLGTRLFHVPRLVMAHLADEAVAHGATQHALASIESRIEEVCSGRS